MPSDNFFQGLLRVAEDVFLQFRLDRIGEFLDGAIRIGFCFGRRC
jgi:hypothetical protein